MSRKLLQEFNDKYHCYDGRAQVRSVDDLPVKQDYIVGVKKGSNIDKVLGSLNRVPDNLQRFELVGNLFSATLSQPDVILLLNHEGVEYVECDAKVSLGIGK